MRCIYCTVEHRADCKEWYVFKVIQNHIFSCTVRMGVLTYLPLSSCLVCALSPSNAVNFVYYQVAAESSEYTFQIFTPANLGTYGLKATEEEIIFEVSQL